jgi:hypothetical protein
MNRRLSFPSLVFLVLAMLVSFFLPAAQPARANPPTREGSVPATIAPTGSIVDKTPTYKWTKVSGATKYQYRVFAGTATLPLWTKTTDSSACGAVNCTRTPTEALVNGKYGWQVRAYVSGAWKAWSLKESFSVMDGFYSQFNGSMNGWSTQAGQPWQVNSTMMYNTGLTQKWSSAIRDTQQYTDFFMTARVRQTGGSYEKNEICVRMGTQVNATVYNWYPGYCFGYQNNGYYIIHRFNANGTVNTIQDLTSNAAITDGWNILKVSANGSEFKYSINGVLLKTFTDTTFAQGYVGFQWARMGSYDVQYQVDWAKLIEYGD